MEETTKNLEYFCILSGGGVRGTSYIGVLRALEELNVELRGIAGSSVGSIFGTYYALGYTPDELAVLMTELKYESLCDLNLSLNKDFGLWKGDNILNWVREVIEKKFYKENYEKGANLPVKFSDLDKDLVIITTDISENKYKEFSRYTTPDEEIAMAIRASISLPGIFRPVWHEGNCLVDGDIIRGLPFWSFSKNLNPKDTRILEFRLEGSAEKTEIKNTIDYVNAVVNTSSNIATEFIMKMYSENDRYDYIKIDTQDTMPVDFIMKNDKKAELIQLGYDLTMNYFKKDLQGKKSKLLSIHKEIYDELMGLEELLSKSQIKEFKFNLSEALFLIMTNKELLEESLYNDCLELLESISSNIFVTKILKVAKIKDKKDIHLKLKSVIESLELKIQELESHLDIIGAI